MASLIGREAARVPDRMPKSSQSGEAPPAALIPSAVHAAGGLCAKRAVGGVYSERVRLPAHPAASYGRRTCRISNALSFSHCFSSSASPRRCCSTSPHGLSRSDMRRRQRARARHAPAKQVGVLRAFIFF
eukprot:7007964-Prymnesium_polylepis.1